MTTEPSELTADDMALMVDVLDTNPSMRSAVHAVKIIEESLSYPISDINVLMQVFGEREYVNVDRCRITQEMVRNYLPSFCFPIHNRRHLICHVIQAFERERGFTHQAPAAV
jgi:hypothetical protein